MYRIETYEHELKATAAGREILQLITTHADEVNRLINNNRAVMLTWQRNKGAVFFSGFLESGFDKDIMVTKETGGISLSSMVRRMAVVLQDHGSPVLSKTIDRYLMLVLSYSENEASLYQVFQKIRQHG